MKKTRVLTATISAFLVIFALSIVLLSERVVHPVRRPLLNSSKIAEAIVKDIGAKVEDCQIVSFDGIALDAWFFKPNNGNGKTVLLLHGQADNRIGVMPYIKLFLRHHYNVLAPDMRAHGNSGGEFASYGLKEAEDVHFWVNWIFDKQKTKEVFGLGESMGAAILLQSLQKERRFSAVVAESSFSNFYDISLDRLSGIVPMPQKLEAIIFKPIIASSFLYAEARYGIDFHDLSPETIAARSQTPILLIHGTNDDSIPFQHSLRILQHRPQSIRLWKVLHARHSGALGKYPSEFEKRVIGFFASF